MGQLILARASHERSSIFVSVLWVRGSAPDTPAEDQSPAPPARGRFPLDPPRTEVHRTWINCAACRTSAARGSFREGEIRIPGRVWTGD